MSLNNDDRFETVEEFWQQLQAHAPQQQEQVPALSSNLISQLLPAQSPGSKPAALLQEHRPASRSRKPLVALLALLALLLTAAGTGAGIMLHAASVPAAVQRNVSLTRNSTAKPSVTQIAGVSIYPSLAVSYTGTVGDIMTNEKTNLLLTDIQQDQGHIHGSFQGLGLIGLFKGTITPSGKVQFTVQIYEGEMILAFDGNIKIGGDLAGNFAVLDQQGQHTGEAGIWNVASSDPAQA